MPHAASQRAGRGDCPVLAAPLVATVAGCTIAILTGEQHSSAGQPGKPQARQSLRARSAQLRTGASLKPLSDPAVRGRTARVWSGTVPAPVLRSGAGFFRRYSCDSTVPSWLRRAL